VSISGALAPAGATSRQRTIHAATFALQLQVVEQQPVDFVGYTTDQVRRRLSIR
jgi:hypothetical protein